MASTVVTSGTSDTPDGIGEVAAKAGTARTTVTCPAPREAWQETLGRDPEALVSQAPAWVDCMRAFGYEDASRLYELPGGRRVVLPLVRRRGPIPAARRVCYSPPPGWGIGGLIADGPLDAAQLKTIVADLRSQPTLGIRIRPNPLHAGLWAVARSDGVIAIPRLAHVVDLDGGATVAWQGLNREARWGVRKARRSGLDVECDRTGRLVPVFFALLELSVQRWAGSQHEPLALARWRARRRDPLAKLQAMAAALGDSLRIWAAFKDGAPVAATIVLTGNNAHSTKSAMDKRLAGQTHAGDLLQWLAIEDACKSGCRRYHLGESGASSALAHFKEKFGARAVPYAEYRFERLPLTHAEELIKGSVKRVLRFRDA